MNIQKNARTTPHSRAEIARRVMVLRETPIRGGKAVAPDCAGTD
jgi:hypothetical protein